MSDSLFNLDEFAQDSPKRAWIKKHKLTVSFDETCEEPWVCYDEKILFEDDSTWGTGDTELDALSDWASKHNVKLWNEA